MVMAAALVLLCKGNNTHIVKKGNNCPFCPSRVSLKRANMQGGMKSLQTTVGSLSRVVVL